jgi:hypothetical protein
MDMAMERGRAGDKLLKIVSEFFSIFVAVIFARQRSTTQHKTAGVLQ